MPKIAQKSQLEWIIKFSLLVVTTSDNKLTEKNNLLVPKDHVIKRLLQLIQVKNFVGKCKNLRGSVFKEAIT